MDKENENELRYRGILRDHRSHIKSEVHHGFIITILNKNKTYSANEVLNCFDWYWAGWVKSGA